MFMNKGQKGFTLAEVLITLGIIGVVAAMTLPTLVQNYKNHVVETRLAKFYSVMNQAVKMAEVDYGDKKIWWDDLKVEFDEDGNPLEGTSDSEKWFRKYLAPYLKITKIEPIKEGPTNMVGSFFVYFPDGSVAAPKNHTSADWQYYPGGNPQKCFKKYNMETGNGNGRCVFGFQFYPTHNDKFFYNKGFEPYKSGWDGTEDDLYNSTIVSYTGCNSPARSAYCTALIQYNGWKIPKDYPFKVD